MSKKKKMQQGQQARSYEKLIGELSRIAAGLSGADAAAVEEAADIIHDYAAATEMTARLIEQYETSAKPIRRDGDFYYCPACCRRISVNNEHCHWCGKPLEW